MGNMSSIVSLLIFTILLVGICCCSGKEASTTSFSCIPEEMNSLLKFKENISDPSSLLLSWNTNNSNNCCRWQGVQCDNITEHVIALDLSNGDLIGGQYLDPSLMGLKYLMYLDLSGNNFHDSSIPSFLGSMKQLQHLNLSGTGFWHVVPHHLGNLSSLRVLDISQVLRGLVVDDFMWVSRLSRLTHLDMSGVDLRQTQDLLKVLNMLPNIEVLNLRYCGLDNKKLQHACGGFNSTLFADLQYLNLTGNLFDGEFPCFLSNMTSLVSLDLSSNQYNSSNLHLIGLNNLAQLNLGTNTIQQKADDWISQFLSGKCYLELLDLNQNSFFGELSGVFLNFSVCSGNNFYGQSTNLLGHSNDSISGNSSALRELYLSRNQLSGPIPFWFESLRNLRILHLNENQLSGLIPSFLGSLKTLTQLNLGDNHLSGPFPPSLGNLSSLRVLDLSSNHQLNGSVPLSLGQLSNLDTLHLFNNSFTEKIVEAHLTSLSMLRTLWIGSNLLKFEIRDDWVPPFQLDTIDLVSCQIGGKFPQWLQTQQKLRGLWLSRNNISGTLPNWLYNMSVIHLFISQNNIEGPVSDIPFGVQSLDLTGNKMTRLPSNIGKVMPDLSYLKLSQNDISGPIPDSICEIQALFYLDLSNNNLTGYVPDCWNNSKELQVMNLHSNKLSGVIPSSISGAQNLQWLRLNNNSFIGNLPYSLINCSSLEILDVGDNIISGELPQWIGTYMINLKVLMMRGNNFHGVIPPIFCQLQLQIIDLADNNLNGNIPRCFGNFSRMIQGRSNNTDFLTFASLTQVIKGSELEYSSDTIYVTNMDLSGNDLVGEIPLELTSLSGVVGLNLSNNQLEGNIPERIGDMISLESLDLSSNNLFGNIPPSLSDLSFLSHLNLSNNNLTGQIPTGRQLQTLGNSSYGGNTGLCGPPLVRNCHDNDAAKEPEVEHHVGEDTKYKILFYGITVSGFATGFWGVIGVLIFKRDWREAFFIYVELMIRKLLRHN